MTNRRTRILVIDSEPRIERQLSRLLDDAHFDVQRVLSGQDGILSARTQTPDCIVLSADLPDGFVHARKLKIDDKLSQIPLILTTGSLDNDTLTKHRKLPSHADAYVTLPIPDPDLLHTVAKLLPGFAAIESDDSEIDDLVDLEIIDENDDSGSDSADVYPSPGPLRNEFSFGDSFLPEPTLPGAELPPYDPDTTRGNAGLSRPASKKRNFGPMQPIVSVPLPIALEPTDARAVRDELKLSQILLRQREEQILTLQAQLDEARRAAQDIELTRRSKQSPTLPAVPPPVPSSGYGESDPKKAAIENQIPAEREREWSQKLQQKHQELTDARKEIESLNKLVEQLNNSENQSTAGRALAEQKLADALANNKLLADQLLDTQEQLEQVQQESKRAERENGKTIEQLNQQIAEHENQARKIAEQLKQMQNTADQFEELATSYLEELETQKEQGREYERQLRDADVKQAETERNIAALRAELDAVKATVPNTDMLLQQAAADRETMAQLTTQIAEQLELMKIQDERAAASDMELEQLRAKLAKLLTEHGESINQIRSQLDAAILDRNAYQMQASAAAADLAVTTELFHEQEKTLASLNVTLAETQESLSSALKSDQEQKIALESLQSQLNDVAADLAVARESLQEQRFLVDSAEERLRESNARYAAVSELNTMLEQQNHELDAAVKQLQTELTSVKATYDLSQIEIKGQNDKLIQLESELNQWQLKTAETVEYADSLENDLARRATEYASLTRLSEEQGIQLRATESMIQDLSTKVAEYERAVENLTERLRHYEAAHASTQSDLKHAREAGMEALEALEEAHVERAKLADALALLRRSSLETEEKLHAMTASFVLEQTKRNALNNSLNVVKDDLARALSTLISMTDAANDPTT
ncbi:MAG: hypothetical protein HUU55_20370 [Myxococcales bacterium]|nr:hypothetical protein [Myxococcales bacterium]